MTERVGGFSDGEVEPHLQAMEKLGVVAVVLILKDGSTRHMQSSKVTSEAIETRDLLVSAMARSPLHDKLPEEVL